MEDYIDEYRQGIIKWDRFCEVARLDIARAMLKGWIEA